MIARWSVVLGSGSPRREILLKKLFAEFEIIAPNVIEEDEEPKPTAFAINIAKRKADAVFETTGECKLVIAADTIVVLDGEILGKPDDRQHAIDMLTRLCGRTHRVITAIALKWPGGEQQFAEPSNVTFKNAMRQEIESYVATGEPLDKAGAYGIQGMGGTLVTRVDGDYENVVGLPVAALREKLIELKLIQAD